MLKISINSFETDYNFDHGFSKPHSVIIGPFTIESNEIHCKNTIKLRKNASISYAYYDNLHRRVISYDKKRGETAETAILKIDSSQIKKSALYSQIAGKTNVDDLCLLLSFLTGRKVYLEHEITDDINTRCRDSVVDKLFFYNPGDVWSKLSRIHELDLSVQFYNIVYIYALNDFLCLTAYANSTFDAICEIWCKKKHYTTYQQKDILKSLTNQFLQQIVDNDIENTVYEDIKSRLDKVQSPSAIFKNKKFLIDLELYPKEDKEKHHKHLKWVNRIRNRVLHSGDILNDKEFDFEMMCEITMSIIDLVLSICQFFFANYIFEIDNDSLKEDKEDILLYFQTGIFRGKKVFEETYSEFMSRASTEWIEHGRIL